VILHADFLGSCAAYSDKMVIFIFREAGLRAAPRGVGQGWNPCPGRATARLRGRRPRTPRGAALKPVSLKIKIYRGSLWPCLFLLGRRKRAAAKIQAFMNALLQEICLMHGTFSDVLSAV